VAESSWETPPPSDGITESLEVMKIHSDWRTPFMIYLRIGGLLEEKVECERLCRRARQYTLVNDDLYRRGANGTLMKCITQKKDKSFCETFTQESTGVTLVQSHSWVRCSGTGSFGSPLYLMSNPLYVGVKGASFLLARKMCHLISCIPYPLPGLFPHGG
jgi:hypothetical protein